MEIDVLVFLEHTALVYSVLPNFIFFQFKDYMSSNVIGVLNSDIKADEIHFLADTKYWAYFS